MPVITASQTSRPLLIRRQIDRVPIEVVVGPPRNRNSPTPKGRGKGKGNKGKGKGKAGDGPQARPGWMTWYLHNTYGRLATALIHREIEVPRYTTTASAPGQLLFWGALFAAVERPLLQLPAHTVDIGRVAAEMVTL